MFTRCVSSNKMFTERRASQFTKHNGEKWLVIRYSFFNQFIMNILKKLSECIKVNVWAIMKTYSVFYLFLKDSLI